MNPPPGFGERPETRTCHGRATPLKLFERLYGAGRFGFLYESLEARGGRGRYSFVGGCPALVFRSYDDRIEIETNGVCQSFSGDPIETLRSLVRARRSGAPVATFCGGAVGYLAYDMVRRFERLPSSKPDDLNHPDACILFPDEIIILDHLRDTAHVILYPSERGRNRMDEVELLLSCGTDDVDERANDEIDVGETTEGAGCAMRANMSREQFEDSVERAKRYIYEGDVFQVVLSQRFSFEVPSTPLDLYAALRITNPSPYMYLLNLGGLHLLGSSPEVLVKLTGEQVVTKPLAGTRRRGKTLKEDDQLAAELCADEKERAEHVMLVDLARNDIGRVCQFGTVRVTDAMQVERFSKVMHMVSNVEGTLKPGLDAFDVTAATFPAGTVSGSPKIRAMQIIDEMEPTRRGVYAGAIGYFSSTGDMDLCIGIRTIVVDGESGYIQAGAGIVADSQPRREHQETLNKASGLMRAVALAQSRSGGVDKRRQGESTRGKNS